MTDPTWPEWGASPPPRPYYPKHYFTGPQGGMHAGEVLDVVTGADVEHPGEQREYSIVRCHPCIGIHAWPLPDAAALKQFYTERFYQEEKPQMTARYQADKEWWIKAVHQPNLQTCKDHLRLDCPEGDRVRFLDIGAGPGLALDTARASFGWETYGLEPNEALCTALEQRGHHMLCGTLASVTEQYPALFGKGSAGPYHVLYLYEVLEHQPCPEAFLIQCWELLAPGGVLVCVVPNDASPLQYAVCAHVGINPYWWAVPEHLAFWTPKTLQLCLRRCGFDLIDMRGTAVLERFILQGYNYLGNDVLGRRVHTQRMQEELMVVHSGHWHDREAVYRANLAERREGREIIAIARRKA